MLKWGTQPRIAGWYWVKGHDFGKYVAKVFLAKNGLLCCILPHGAVMQGNFSKYEWAGPLPEPVD